MLINRQRCYPEYINEKITTCQWTIKYVQKIKASKMSTLNINYWSQVQYSVFQSTRRTKKKSQVNISRTIFERNVGHFFHKLRIRVFVSRFADNLPNIFLETERVRILCKSCEYVSETSPVRSAKQLARFSSRLPTVWHRSAVNQTSRWDRVENFALQWQNFHYRGNRHRKFRIWYFSLAPPTMGAFPGIVNGSEWDIS